MPAKSKAQARAMYAAAKGKSTLGIPKAVGKEYTAPMGKGDVAKLPARAKSKRK